MDAVGPLPDDEAALAQEGVIAAGPRHGDPIRRLAAGLDGGGGCSRRQERGEAGRSELFGLERVRQLGGSVPRELEARLGVVIGPSDLSFDHFDTPGLLADTLAERLARG